MAAPRSYPGIKPSFPRENFDSIFTGEFFKEPIDEKQTDEKLQPVSFPMPPGKTIGEFTEGFATFLKSEDGKQYKKGVEEIIRQLEKLIHNWADEKSIEQKESFQWTAKLENFLEKRFLSYDGLNTNSNQHYFELYQGGVHALNVLLQKVSDPTIPLPLRQNVLRTLLKEDELMRCGPGTAEFIDKACLALKLTPAEALMAARKKIVENVVALNGREYFAGTYRLVGHWYPYEVHYAMFFVNQYLKELGLTQKAGDHLEGGLLDPVIKILFPKILADLPAAITLEKVLAELLQKFDLDKMVKDLQESKEDFFKLYKLQMEILETSLVPYGVNKDWGMSQFFIIDDSDDLSIKIDPEANKRLEITLIHGLFESGYLDKECRLEIPVPESKDVLYALLGKNNASHSYVMVAERKYDGIETYFNQQTQPQKMQIAHQLLQSPAKDLFKKLAQKNEDIYLLCLEEKMISINEEDRDGIFPIVFATKSGFLNVVKYLVEECKVDIEKNYEDGDNEGSPLYYAAISGHINVIEYLSKKMNIGEKAKKKSRKN